MNYQAFRMPQTVVALSDKANKNVRIYMALNGFMSKSQAIENILEEVEIKVE